MLENGLGGIARPFHGARPIGLPSATKIAPGNFVERAARGGRIQKALGLFVPCGLRALRSLLNAAAFGRMTCMEALMPRSHGCERVAQSVVLIHLPSAEISKEFSEILECVRGGIARPILGARPKGLPSATKITPGNFVEPNR